MLRDRSKLPSVPKPFEKISDRDDQVEANCEAENQLPILKRAVIAVIKSVPIKKIKDISSDFAGVEFGRGPPYFYETLVLPKDLRYHM